MAVCIVENFKQYQPMECIYFPSESWRDDGFITGMGNTPAIRQILFKKQICLDYYSFLKKITFKIPS